TACRLHSVDLPARRGGRREAAGGAEPSFHAVRRKLNRLDDLRVAGAAAQVAGKRLADLVARWIRAGFEQRARRQQDARRAVTALRSSQLGERRLQWMELGAVCHALDGRDGAALQLYRQQQAAQLRPAVDEHSACAAFAKPAPLL